MKRTSYLSAKGQQFLRNAGQRLQSSMAFVVRTAMSRRVHEPGPAARLPSVTGYFLSGIGDTAERTDALLWRDPHA